MNGSILNLVEFLPGGLGRLLLLLLEDGLGLIVVEEGHLVGLVSGVGELGAVPRFLFGLIASGGGLPGFLAEGVEEELGHAREYLVGALRVVSSLEGDDLLLALEGVVQELGVVGGDEGVVLGGEEQYGAGGLQV